MNNQHLATMMTFDHNYQPTLLATPFEQAQANVDYAEQVSHLCLTHQSSKKWILLIDGEVDTVSALSNKPGLDKSKILHINNRKVKVAPHNIETALAKGNCSAVVLINNNLQQEQISHLSQFAKQTATTFLVLNNAKELH